MTFRPTSLLLAAAAVVAVCPRPAFAVDVVETVDGERIRGREPTVTRAGLTFVVAGQERFVPACRVVRVDWDGTPSELRLVDAKADERPLDALDDYARLLADAAGRVRTEIAFREAKLAARVALGEAGDGSDATIETARAAERLRKFVASAPETYRTDAAARWLGRVALDAGDADAIGFAARVLADSPTPLDRAVGRALAAAAERSSTSALFDACEADIEGPLGEDLGPAPAAVRYEARLLVASAARFAGLDDAAGRYTRLIDDLGPVDFGPVDATRAAAFFGRAEASFAAGDADSARLDLQRLVWLTPHLRARAADASARLAQTEGGDAGGAE